MRRREKEITEHKTIEEIIRRSLVCRLALVDNGIPYIVPLCFGYRENSLYFHAATEGRKLEILRTNPAVCFEFDTDQEVIAGKNACHWGMKYRSVIGHGTATLVNDPQAKRTALQCIMEQYAGQGRFEFVSDTLQRTVIIKVDIKAMSGKVSGYENNC
jgi:nitroimidazol reductase NimA-like FMN-containing flavoprotein (pyridoxamine 5'-phosphate oxidase superfamily)